MSLTIAYALLFIFTSTQVSEVILFYSKFTNFNIEDAPFLPTQ